MAMDANRPSSHIRGIHTPLLQHLRTVGTEYESKNVNYNLGQSVHATREMSGASTLTSAHDLALPGFWFRRVSPSRTGREFIVYTAPNSKNSGALSRWLKRTDRDLPTHTCLRQFPVSCCRRDLPALAILSNISRREPL